MIDYGNYGYHAYDDISATETTVGTAGDAREQVPANCPDDDMENGWHRRSEMKACPFCGGKAKTTDTEFLWSMDFDHDPNCFFVTVVNGEWRTKAEAIEAWNTRAYIEPDNRVYIPHPGTCKVVGSSTNNLMFPDYMTKWYELSCGHSVALKGCEPPSRCAVCGKVVTR